MKSFLDFSFIVPFFLCLMILVLFEWQTVKSKAYEFMLVAKKKAKDDVLKTGAEQEDHVVEAMISYLPNWIEKAISKEVIRKMIVYLYRKAFDYLDDGMINDSNKKEG